MSRAFTLEGRINALQSTLFSKNTHTRELELQFLWSNSELDTEAEELDPTEPRLRFTEDTVSLILGQVQKYGPQFRKAGAA